MQRKRRNINFGNFSKSPGKYQKKFNNSITNTTLHSIPTVRMSEIGNKKSLVAERNPFCGQFPKRFICLGFATLLIFGLVLTDINLLSDHAYALEEVQGDESSVFTSELSDASEEPEEEEASVSSINNDDNANDTPVTFSTRAATVGLTIDGSTSSSTESVTVAPGSVGYSKEHTVSVNVTDASAYTLKISGNTNLSGPSGATTIGGAGNKTPANMTDNTWGYGWGSTGTAKESLYYQSLSTGGANLSVDNLSTSGSASFSRKLVFAAKFASNNTNAGTYRGNVTLSLVVTPRKNLGEWRTSNATSDGYNSGPTIRDSGITTMQQMTSSICNQVSTPAASSTTVPTMRLKDSRDDNEYIIAKYADGRCWMTSNLLLKGRRTLTPADSDVKSNYTLPAPLTSLSSTDFSKSNYYLAQSYSASSTNSGNTIYYSWTAATAGTGISGTTSGNASSSICSKGWKLPSGGSDGELLKFTKAAAISTSSSGSTKIQAAPYNFKLTGYIYEGSLVNTDESCCWSGTSTHEVNPHDVYLMRISTLLFPGTATFDRYMGFAVRCIASN